jgi:hypothetical protein
MRATTPAGIGLLAYRGIRQRQFYVIAPFSDAQFGIGRYRSTHTPRGLVCNEGLGGDAGGRFVTIAAALKLKRD